MTNPSSTLMGSLLFAAEAGGDAYHDPVVETKSGLPSTRWTAGCQAKGPPGPNRAVDRLAGPVPGDAVEEAEVGAEPGAPLYAEASGAHLVGLIEDTNLCAFRTGQWIGSLGLFLAVQPERL